jgi:hypothetical protein
MTTELFILKYGGTFTCTVSHNLKECDEKQFFMVPMLKAGKIEYEEIELATYIKNGKLYFSDESPIKESDLIAHYKNNFNGNLFNKLFIVNDCLGVFLNEGDKYWGEILMLNNNRKHIIYKKRGDYYFLGQKIKIQGDELH